MLLSEMFDEVIVRSGQYILDKEDLEVDADRFKILVKSVLRLYNGHRPWVKRQTVRIVNEHKRYLNIAPDLAPKFISDVIPLRLRGGLGLFLEERHNQRFGDLIKEQFIWRYENPTLYVEYDGDFDITEVHTHQITQTADSEPKDQVASIDGTEFGQQNADEADAFFDLLTGRFLQSIGRNRRAFTINEMPLTTDAAELVSDGNEIWQNAFDHLTENRSKWYLAWS